jgi:hypothetical protein
LLLLILVVTRLALLTDGGIRRALVTGGTRDRLLVVKLLGGGLRVRAFEAIVARIARIRITASVLVVGEALRVTDVSIGAWLTVVDGSGSHAR